jgi:putative transposase
MTYAFIATQQGAYPLRRLCQALSVSPSGYYAWRGRPLSRRQREDRRLKVAMRAAFRRSRQAYGSPRLQEALATQGLFCSRKRVARLMREEGLVPKKVRQARRTTHSIGTHPKAPNLLNRQFTVRAPDTVWAGDITYLWTDEGWLYLAVVLDLYSRRVVGWSISDRLTQELAIAALQRALSERHVDEDLLHHSDRGSQYTSEAYQRLLRARGLRVSMSRSGDCWDNAVVESFFATLKTELGERFPSRSAAHLQLFDYIEVFYNRQRLHSSLGYLTPVQIEARFAREAAA